MASKNNLIAVQLSLVFFVMASIICGVMGYLNYDDLKKVRAEVAGEKKKFEDERKARRYMEDEVAAIKTLIGHEYDDVGLDDDSANDEGPETVMRATRSDLKKYGSGLTARRDKQGILKDVQLPEAQFSATLERMRREIDRLGQERNQLQVELNKKQQAYRKIAPDKQKLIADAETKRIAAEKTLQNSIKTSDETLTKQNDEIKKTQDEIAKVRGEIEQEKEGSAKEIEQKEQRIVNLRTTNAQLNRKIEQATSINFVKPDGLIRWIDRGAGLVWINLGKADRLPERMNFLVYAKASPGVDRGEKDLKGSIEVTKIRDRHLAEARILEADFHRPIALGDFVYTPLWSPGRKEKFALAGRIDIDRDGRSDRKLVHDLIAANGSSVSTEIDDRGKRTGEPIDVNTKFLVIGEIPTAAGGGEEKQVASAYAAEWNRISQEARERGVRIVNLNDFLAYLDYKPKRRSRTPGGQTGAKNGGADKADGQGASTGKSSSAPGGRKRFGRQKSHGRIIKTFRGGKRGS